MKRYLPNWLKFPFWYIFKAPQRHVYAASLLRDVYGLFQYVWVQPIPVPKQVKLSICVGNFNRNDMLLQYFLPSLKLLDKTAQIELVLVDFGSANFLVLKERLEKEWRGTLKIIVLEEPFTRARAINVAVGAATGDLVFIADADFSLPKQLLKYSYQYTLGGRIWFPIVYYLYKDKPASVGRGNGEWMQWGGKGILAIHRNIFLEMKGLDESFKSWGGEDEEFWMRCHAAKKVVLRNRCKGLLHHWHPSFNPKYKNL